MGAQCRSPWCNNWIERPRKDGRCHDPECEKRLWEEAFDRGLAVKDAGLTVGRIEPLLIDPYVPTPECNIESFLDSKHACKCKRDIMLPGKNMCRQCYVEYVGTKAKQSRSQPKRKKGRNRKLFNGIRGFEKVR